MTYQFTGTISGGNLLPAIESGDAGKVPVVNQAETGYELVALPTGGGGSQPNVSGIVNANVAADGTTDDTAAIQTALDAVSAAGGGVVQLPRGTIKTTATLTISPFCTLQGVGMATILKFAPASAGTAIRMGPAVANVLQYGMGLRDIDIVLETTGSTGLRLVGAIGADVSNVFIESAPLKAQTGVVIDGSNISGFFNHFSNVQAHHVRYGFRFTTSGTLYPTQQMLLNCRVVGDAIAGDTASLGLVFDKNACGQDTTMQGGYLENVMTGVHVPPGIAVSGVKLFGVAFENGHANAADIDLGSSATNFGFYGCITRTASLAIPSGKGHVRL